ncbi:MAG: TonB-dependent receptor plug domain-containing protein [Akkermansiaceae bacterium]
METERLSAEWKNRFEWNEYHETTGGIAVSWLDTMNTGAAIAEKSERNTSFYLQHRWHSREKFDLLGGIRHDQYDDGEGSTTFRIAGAYHINEKVELHGSVASGFRRPSVVDLYGFFGSGGNLNLKSETSLGWDLGVQYSPNENHNFDLTFFHNDIDDLIASGPGPAFTAMNVQEARTRGFEFSYKAKWLQDRVETRLAYTWLQAENLTSDSRLLRRPTHTLNADVNVAVTDTINLGAGVTWVADREDSDAATFARIDADDYIVARIYGSWQATENVQFNARVENLFDEQYSEVDGFPARGVGAFAGVTLKW